MNVHYILKTIYTVMLIIIVCVTPAILGCQKFIEQRQQYYYNKGLELFKNKNFVDAAKEFEKAIQFDRKNFDALFMHGMCNYSMGNYGAAKRSFIKASTERPDDVQLKLKIAECRLNLWDFGIITYFKSVIEPLADKDREARFLLLKFYLQYDMLSQAEEIIEKILKEGDNTPAFSAVLVWYNLKRKKTDDAVNLALKDFSYTTDWMQAIKRLIEQLQRYERYDDLEKIYIKVIEKAEPKLPYQQELARLFRKRAAEKEEEALLQAMLKDNPEKLEIKRQYVDFLKYYNRITHAEAFINDELKKQPHNIELQKLLIDTYMNTGQQQKAFQAVESVLSALPVDDNRYTDFQNILAELNFRSGAVDKAKLIIKDILNKNKLNRDARFLLCRIFLQEGDTLSAVGELRRLISENPTIAEFSYYLGVAHEKRGDYVLAENAFRRALDVTPDYKDALVKWITIYPKEGSLSEVENRIKKYLELHPDDNEIRQLQDSIRETKSNLLSHLNILGRAKG